MKRRRFRTILLILLLVIVLIQFLPVNRSVPQIDPSQDFIAVTHTSADLGRLIKDACYDCHSYETEYPWYSYVSPVSLWLQNHINEGREHLNFSIWATYPANRADHKLKEAVEHVKEKEMPLNSFMWMHPEARLTDTQRADLAAWFQGLRTGAGEDNRSRQSEEEEEND